MPHKPQSRMNHKDRAEELAFQLRCAQAGLSVSAYLRRLARLEPMAEPKDSPHYKSKFKEKIA